MKETLQCESCLKIVKSYDDFVENHEYCIQEWLGINKKQAWEDLVIDI